MKFNIGDTVITKNGYIEGEIVDIEDDVAFVEYSTGRGGGTIMAGLDELELVPNITASLRAFKSAHGTANVVIHYCIAEVRTLLTRFDVWNSGGRFEYDESKPNERAKIWFECPIEFLDFVESNMGKAVFQRMGVEEFYIEC